MSSPSSQILNELPIRYSAPSSRPSRISTSSPFAASPSTRKVDISSRSVNPPVLSLMGCPPASSLSNLFTAFRKPMFSGRLWCWEGLGAGGEGDDRGWDCWMASPTRWMWLWVNSGSWWWTGRPGMMWFMGSQRVGHHWATELNWTELTYKQKTLFK